MDQFKVGTVFIIYDKAATVTKVFTKYEESEAGLPTINYTYIDDKYKLIRERCICDRCISTEGLKPINVEDWYEEV